MCLVNLKQPYNAQNIKRTLRASGTHLVYDMNISYSTYIIIKFWWYEISGAMTVTDEWILQYGILSDYSVPVMLGATLLTPLSTWFGDIHFSITSILLDEVLITALMLH